VSFGEEEEDDDGEDGDEGYYTPDEGEEGDWDGVAVKTGQKVDARAALGVDASASANANAGDEVGGGAGKEKGGKRPGTERKGSGGLKGMMGRLGIRSGSG
jgi:hypothetical protein